MLKMSGDNTPPGLLTPPFPPPDFRREGRVGDALTFSANCFNREGFAADDEEEEGDKVDERDGDIGPVEVEFCKAGDPALPDAFV